MNDFSEAIRLIPPVTRFFTVTFGATALAVSLELLSPIDFVFNPALPRQVILVLLDSEAKNKLAFLLSVMPQLYRLITTFFPLRPKDGLSFLAYLHTFYFYSRRLETRHFKMVFPDYVWCVLVIGAMLHLVDCVFYGYIVPGMAPSWHLPQGVDHNEQLSTALMFLGLRLYKYDRLNFFGLIPIQLNQAPLLILLVNAITGGYPAVIMTILGFFGAYLFLCIQSATIPILNFWINTNNTQGRRVGYSSSASHPLETYTFTTWEQGYLKAPLWLYRFLNYPYGTSVRLTHGSNHQAAKRQLDRTIDREALRSNFSGKGFKLGT